MENKNDDFIFDEEMLDQLLEDNSTRAAEPSSRISRRMDPILEGILPGVADIPAAEPSEEINPILEEILNKVTGKLPNIAPAEAPQNTLLVPSSELPAEDVIAPPAEAVKTPPVASVMDEEEDFMKYVTAAPGEIPLETPEKPKPKEPPKKRDDFAEEINEMEIQPEKPKKQKKEGAYGFFGIPHLLASVIWMAIIVIIGVSLGRVLWVVCSDVMAFGKPDQAITITITDQEVKQNPDDTKSVDIDSIAQKLKAAGLIENPDVFKLFATLTGKDQDIAPGTYTLNSYFDYNAMINGMTYSAPAREIVTVLIPEGYNCAQTFALLEDKGVCSAKELEEYAANGELKDYWFLDGVKRGTKYCLEGYMFPDTYEFYTNDEPRRVIEKFLNDFDYRFKDEMKDNFQKLQDQFGKMLAANGYSADYIADHKLTLHQLVTMASIVEKESSNDSESYQIASVFYNRLADPSNYPYLDSDATVHYAIGDYFGKITKLSQTHLDTRSPYNTRGYQQGLPPGPICNPGIYSLYAALDPDETSYHFFVLNKKTGLHVFSNTYKEHQQRLKELGYT